MSVWTFVPIAAGLQIGILETSTKGQGRNSDTQTTMVLKRLETLQRLFFAHDFMLKKRTFNLKHIVFQSKKKNYNLCCFYLVQNMS